MRTMWILQDVIKIFFVILRRLTKYNLSIYFIVSKSVSCNKILDSETKFRNVNSNKY